MAINWVQLILNNIILDKNVNIIYNIDGNIIVINNNSIHIVILIINIIISLILLKLLLAKALIRLNLLYIYKINI